MTSKSLLGEITSMIPLAIFNSSSIEAWPVHINVLAGVSRTNTSSELSEAVTSSTCSALKERKKKNQPQHFHEFFERIFSSSIKISNYNMKILSKCNAERETLLFLMKTSVLLQCIARISVFMKYYWGTLYRKTHHNPHHGRETILFHRHHKYHGRLYFWIHWPFHLRKKSYKAMFCLLVVCS